MKPLTLDKALLLYETIGEYIPEFEEEKALEFVGKIVSNIRQSEHPEKYVDAIILMSGNTVLEISSMASNERLELFVGGLIENKIYRLKDFCDKMGLSYA